MLNQIKVFFNKIGNVLLLILFIIPWILYWVYKKSNVKETFNIKQKVEVKKVENSGYKNDSDIKSLSQAVDSAKAIIKNF